MDQGKGKLVVEAQLHVPADFYDHNSVAHSYNTDFHRTIQGEPIDVWEGKEKNKQELKNPTFDFQEGDDVRLFIRKGAFEKGTYE